MILIVHSEQAEGKRKKGKKEEGKESEFILGIILINYFFWEKEPVASFPSTTKKPMYRGGGEKGKRADI